jgi:Druantia protein DruA
MNEALVVQGRQLETSDIFRIRQLMIENPAWSRRRLSEVLAQEWDWRNGSGRLKDMAARTLLLKLAARGLIELPARRRKPSNRMAEGRLPRQDWDLTPVSGTLRQLDPLKIHEISRNASERQQFAAALAEFHYLGYRGTVGENTQYAVTDAAGRLLACLLFGAPAWKCRARDEFIGWGSAQRQQRLNGITNNTRFLILPFVRVPHLASWILGQTLRRLSRDWQQKYGHPVYLVETFVERDRFAGTSYKAANWIRLGSTTGRSRQDHSHTLRVPVKDVYVYPLHPRYRQELSA